MRLIAIVACSSGPGRSGTRRKPPGPASRRTSSPPGRRLVGHAGRGTTLWVGVYAPGTAPRGRRRDREGSTRSIRVGPSACRVAVDAQRCVGGARPARQGRACGPARPGRKRAVAVGAGAFDVLLGARLRLGDELRRRDRRRDRPGDRRGSQRVLRGRATTPPGSRAAVDASGSDTVERRRGSRSIDPRTLRVRRIAGRGDRSPPAAAASAASSGSTTPDVRPSARPDERPRPRAAAHRRNARGPRGRHPTASSG